MIRFLGQRLLQSLFVLGSVGLVAFALFNFIGDPVASMVGAEASLAERARIRESLGLDRSFLVQFATFVGNVLRGDFGVSYRLSVPVDALIRERLPATLELSVCAAVLALGLGIPMGIIAAVRPRHWLTRVFLTLSLVGVSLPTFVIAMLLIYVFAVTLGWLPSFGRGDTVQIGFWATGLLTASGLKSLVLPAVTLTLFQLTLIMRIVRAEMQDVLRSDYVRFARARGIPLRRVHYGHALRNTMIPVTTAAGLQIGSIVAFAIITETVFQWPGMGFLFIQAVQAADVPVLAAYLVLVAALLVAINLAVDVLYVVLDPRLRARLRLGASA